MNKKQFCQKLLIYKDGIMPIYLFLGGKWIFLKVILLAGGGLLLLSNATEAKVFGGIVIGYAIGKIAAGLISYRASRKTWRYSNDLLNWDKIAEYAAGEDDKET